MVVGSAQVAIRRVDETREISKIVECFAVSAAQLPMKIGSKVPIPGSLNFLQEN